MTPTPTTDDRGWRLTPVGVMAGIVGLALFIYTFQRAGLSDIVALVRRLGWMFVVVVALGGLRFLARGMAWRGCLEGPHRLGPGRAFQAVTAGDTLGNLTFLSLLVSEPAKAVFVTDREPVSRTLPALAVENLFYSLSAAFVIAGGAVALVLRLRTTDVWWLASMAVVALIIILIALAHLIIWRKVRVASGALDVIARRGLAPRLVGRWAERVRQAEDHVHRLYPRDPGRLLRVTGWELVFHGLAVLEIFLVLSIISPVTPTVLDAFVFESINRFIAVVFRVVPMRVGVDEAGTAVFAELLAFGTAAGVTLAIVRKARMLVWMIAGGAFLLRRGLSVAGAIADAETARVTAGDGQGR